MSGDLSTIDGTCCVATVRSVVPGSPLAASLASAGIVPGPRNLEVNLDAGAFSRSTNAGASVEVTWRLGEHELTSLTAWRTWELRENTDSDNTPQQALSINFGRSDLDQLTQELRLASPTGGRLEYVVGLYYFDAELLGNNGQLGSLSLTSATPVSSRFFVATNRTESLAAFGQATFRATEKLRLILGARYTHDDVSMDFERSFFPGTVPSSPPLTLHPSTSASNLSWRAGRAVRFRAGRHGLCDRVARLQGPRLQRPAGRDDRRRTRRCGPKSRPATKWGSSRPCWTAG